MAHARPLGPPQSPFPNPKASIPITEARRCLVLPEKQVMVIGNTNKGSSWIYMKGPTKGRHSTSA